MSCLLGRIGANSVIQPPLIRVRVQCTQMLAVVLSLSIGLAIVFGLLTSSFIPLKVLLHMLMIVASVV
jgi:hypothetical protein